MDPTIESLNADIARKDALIRSLLDADRAQKRLVSGIRAWAGGNPPSSAERRLDDLDRDIFQYFRRTRAGRKKRPSSPMDLYHHHQVVRDLVMYIRDQVLPIQDVCRYLDQTKSVMWSQIRDIPYIERVLSVEGDHVRLTQGAVRVFRYARARIIKDGDDDPPQTAILSATWDESRAPDLMDLIREWWESQRCSEVVASTEVPTQGDAEGPSAGVAGCWSAPSPSRQEEILRSCFRRSNTAVPHLIRFLGPGPRSKAETRAHMCDRPTNRVSKRTGRASFQLRHYTHWGAHKEYGVVEEFLHEATGKPFLRLTEVAQRVYDSL